MQKIAAFLSVVSLYSSGLVAQEAGQSYLLASGEPPLPLGQVYKVTETGAINEAPMELAIQGRTLKGALTMASRDEVEYQFSAEDRIRAKILVDRSSGKRGFGGQAEEVNEVKVTEGQVFLLSKKEGKWTATPELAEIEPADKEAFDDRAEELVNSFERRIEEDLKLYGDQPRKVGETWKVDALQLPGMDGIEVMGGKVEMSFLRVEEVQGEPCAVLKAIFGLSGQMEGDQMKGLGVEMKGAVTITRSLKYFLDYEVTGRIGVEMVGEIKPQPGMVARLKVTGDLNLSLKASKQDKE